MIQTLASKIEPLFGDASPSCSAQIGPKRCGALAVFSCLVIRDGCVVVVTCSETAVALCLLS